MKVIHKKEAWRRSYSLNIDHNGALIVRTNKLCTRTQLDRIIKRHRIWISRRLKEHEEISKKANTRGKRALAHGDQIEILGDRYILFVSIRNTHKRTHVRIVDDRVVIESKSLLHQLETKKVLEQSFRRLIRKVIERKVAYYCQIYGVDYKRLFIKSQKSKWGSCSSDKNLNFNWKLLFCPLEVLEYVVIHEVCHLKELNHSKNFWDLVSLQCPDYRERKKWLRVNGQSIMEEWA